LLDFFEKLKIVGWNLSKEPDRNDRRNYERETIGIQH